MSPVLATLIMLAGLTGTSGSAGVAQQLNRPVTAQASRSSVAANTVVTSVDVVGETLLPEQTQENVLVVPTPDLPAESWADITEDLSIMCRIFDKSLPPTGSGVSFGYGDRGEPFHWVMAQQGRGTQGLYLDGYGALFFLRADYPLAPTEKQDAAPAKPKEPVDSVWDQTVREMSGQPGDESQSTRKTPAYDSQKVEDLKKTLIKTLPHASNIRMRRPQDVITLVVGAPDDTKASVYRRLTGTSTTRPAARPGVAAAGAAQPGARNPATTLMILRVAKADIDAFVKNQLTLMQFTDKVQILFSPSVSTAPATSATGPSPVNPRR